ncbi:MAG: choice-of-anchor Q domain-containing protein [bacterium]
MPARIAVVALGVLLALPHAARAATWVVTTTSDSGAGSLRAAVQSAEASPDADTIVFDPSLAGATITLSTTAGTDFGGSSALVITGELVIDGTAAPGLTIEPAESAPSMRFLMVDDGAATGADVTVRRLSIRRFSATSAPVGLAVSSAPSAADGLGGCLLNRGGMLAIEESTIGGCMVVGSAGTAYGGGIANYDGTLVVRRSAIIGNGILPIVGGSGGAIANLQVSSTAATTVESSTLIDNMAESEALYDYAGTVTVESSTLMATAALPLIDASPGALLSMGSSILVGTCAEGVTVESLGYNVAVLLVPGSCGLAGIGDQAGVPLGDLGIVGCYLAGGPTVTCPLASTSVAIDTGSPDCPVLDQRRVIRPLPGSSGAPAKCDSGAVEYDALLIFGDGFETGDANAWYQG